jgi:hypothetical protein
VDNTTNTVANKGVSFFLLIASATGCTKQGLSSLLNIALEIKLKNFSGTHKIQLKEIFIAVSSFKIQ